jgi:membrane protease YdiL (CAAX protease family)
VSALALLGQESGGSEQALLADPATPLFALVLALGGLALVPPTIALVRRLTPRVPVFFARWRFSHLGLVLAAGVLFVGLGANALPELAPGASRSLMQVFGACLGLAATCGVIVAIARRMDPDGARGLGLWRGGQARAAAVGVLAYLLCLPTLLGLALLWPWVHVRLGGAWEPQVFFDEFASARGAGLWALVLVVVAVQPLLEELIFRAFLQPLLVQNLGDRGGLALTSALFALLHGPGFFLPIFALSLLLGALKLRTQRLAASWAVHSVHNGLMVAVALLDAGPGGVA